MRSIDLRIAVELNPRKANGSTPLTGALAT